MKASKQGLQSIAMTLMGTTYRVSAKESIFALTKGLAAVRGEDIEIKWCFLRDEDFQYATKICDSLMEL